MDKTLLKKFAIESRKELVEKITFNIKKYYVDKEFKEVQKGEVYVLSNNDISLSYSKEEYDKRKLLINRIRELGLGQVIEEASYTWFNRIIAIRYMELNDMLPLTKENDSLGIRVLSSKYNDLDPEILEYSNIINPELDLNINKDKFSNLASTNDKFKYILIKVCEKLGKTIPQVFDGVTDYINILTPDNMLNEDRIIGKLVKEIPEDNFKDVEVIGWLYQYYNQTEKDRVMAAKKSYKKNEIPFATQLFTPDWIVKYMVENSLGKYWLENHGDNQLCSSDNLFPSDNLHTIESLKDNWKYYIEDAKQAPEVEKELNELKNSKINPKDITFIDPCCGSGHILVYAFDVLYQIYESYGYNKKDIAKLIIENNLYGLDIDDRAGQLSILSVLLKARSYDKNLFQKELKLNILSIQESNNIDENALYEIRSKDTDSIIDYVIETFKDAKEYGSILKVKNMDYQSLINKVNNVTSLFKKELEEKLIPLLQQASILCKNYDIVVTNPPYMNKGSMSDNLRNYVFENYSSFKTDMFSVFLSVNSKFGKSNSYLGFMMPYVWMFISSYEEMRDFLINKLSFVSLVQLEYSAFEEAVVPICTFVIKNNNLNKNGTFIKLSDFRGGMEVQRIKVLKAAEKKDLSYTYNNNINNFKDIPGTPIAYWLSESVLKVFKSKEKIMNIVSPKAGIVTGEDNYFLKLWYEINYQDIKFNYKKSNNYGKYHLFQKGGGFRRYYGNNEYVIALEKLYNPSLTNKSVRKGDRDFYFSKGIGWSQIGSNTEKSFRIIENSVCGTATPSFYLKKDEDFNYILGLLNTKVSELMVNIFNPTLNLLTTDVCNIPLMPFNLKQDEINCLVAENIIKTKIDWDSFENSWDFKKHPLLEFRNSMPGLVDSNISPKPITALTIAKNNYGEDVYLRTDKTYRSSIMNSYKQWEEFTNKQFKQLKSNEEELNRIFIDIYGLQDELTPEVIDKNITIRQAGEEREIKSLISYSVGCMFGRYSLDEEGLIYAGGAFDPNRYKSIKVDRDNIIPINDNSYFMDDIVAKFKEFIKAAFGEETLNENLEYVADVLGKRNTETSEETIRRYFINDFYKDHLKTYKNKPIYWLFDSGKANGFKCLTYMHRYDENLVAKIRMDYLHKIQRSYENQFEDVKYKLAGELNLSDKKDAMNLQKDLSNKLTEIKEYDEKVDHIANHKITIDLDDGVTVNYDKFKDILAKIK